MSGHGTYGHLREDDESAPVVCPACKRGDCGQCPDLFLYPPHGVVACVCDESNPQHHGGPAGRWRR